MMMRNWTAPMVDKISVMPRNGAMHKRGKAKWAMALVVLFGIMLAPGQAVGLGFFSIKQVEYQDKAPRKGPALFIDEVKPDGTKEQVFVPSLFVEIEAEAQIRSKDIFVKAYFFGPDDQRLSLQEKPYEETKGYKKRNAMPVLLPGQERVPLFFPVPPEVLKVRNWRAVVVFGDEREADAVQYPKGMLASALEFPERKQFEHPQREIRKAAMDPLIEHVVRTRNEKQPQITLFLRPPIGMTDASKAKGVLALCLLANNLEGLKRQLQAVDESDEVGGWVRFAEENQFVILCWGSTRLWDPRRNWDDLSKDELKELEENWEDFSKAWARGVEELVEEYGIPGDGFFLWGISGSAQYAMRMALRQPHFFHAVNVHIPSSFARPTPEGRGVLWCLTTGELESGYERSLNFYQQCKDLGYPMVYRAIIGLGHSGHPTAAKLGREFFQYALTIREERAAHEAAMEDSFSETFRRFEEHPSTPWPASFREPLYVGDIVNQEVYPLSEWKMVPEPFLTPLPSKSLADIWGTSDYKLSTK